MADDGAALRPIPAIVQGILSVEALDTLRHMSVYAYYGSVEGMQIEA
jgi:hypothetical protein